MLDEITNKLDIVDVISEYLSLKKAGKNFKAVCPFHEEKTPSFFVNPEKQIFHCFGCGIGGNIFKFLMNIENISFPEAVILAAKKAGVEISITAMKSNEEREKIMEVNKTAAEIYNELIFAQQGKRALEYFYKRNLNNEDIKKYLLGYAPYDSDFLIKKIKEKDTNSAQFVKAGLIDIEKGKDFFRNRIIFPIFNIKSDIVGFGARALDDNQMPKYLNTAENPVFNKSWVLYGMNWAKKEIKEKGYVILVEGYFDVLRLHINGIQNCIAPLGTSVTSGHLKLLKRFTDNILIIFDSDQAGIKATMRSIESILQNGFQVKIGALPSGFDPDKFIDEYGVETFKNFLNQSQGFIDFFISMGKQIYDMNLPKEKSTLAKEILLLIAIVPDEIEKEEYIKQLGKKLDIREEVLRKSFEEIEKKEEKHSIKKEIEEEILSGKELTESELMEILFIDKDYWGKIWEWQGGLTERIEKVLECAENFKKQNLEIQPSALIGHIQEENISNWLVPIALRERIWDTEKKEHSFRDCIKKLHDICLAERKTEHLKKLGEKQEKGLSYDKELEEIQNILYSIKKG